MNKKYLSAAFGALAATPFFAAAQAAPNTGYVTTLIGQIRTIVASLVPVLIGITVVVFFWNVVKFVAAGANDEARKEAKGMMIWSLVAIFVMVSIWGLIAWVQSLTGVGGGSVSYPTLP